jgi:hypothetical protein
MNAMKAKKPNEKVYVIQPGPTASRRYTTYPEVCDDADIFEVLESLFVEKRSRRFGWEPGLEEEERKHSAEEGEQRHDAACPRKSDCAVVSCCRVNCGMRPHSLFPGRSASINGQMTAPREEPVLISPLPRVSCQLRILVAGHR